MPAFAFSFTIPKNTPLTRPIRQVLGIKGDFITRCEVFFPAGHCCLTGVQMRYGEAPIWPSEVEQFFRGEDALVAQDVRWTMPSHEITLTFVMFNEDDTYDHTVYGNIYTKWLEELEPVGLLRQVAILIRTVISRLLGLRRR